MITAKNPAVISEEEYAEMVDQYLGICLSCGDRGRDCTEPDAEDYKCPACDEYKVCGAENALLMRLISFE